MIGVEAMVCEMTKKKNMKKVKKIFIKIEEKNNIFNVNF